MKALVIVDVQKEFNKFIQHDLVDELYDYARKFKQVYQIWDTHKTDIAPTYVFPNQVDAVKKKYGKNHFSDKVTKFIKNKTDETFEGNLFKLSDGEGYIVRVDNNHDWFYVNPEIVELIQKLKDKQVILAGGADNECLEDVYQAFKAFGLNVHINKKYVYSAKTNQNDSIDDNVKESINYKLDIYIIAYDRETCLELEDFVHKNGYTYISKQTYLLDRHYHINEVTFYDFNIKDKTFKAYGSQQISGTIELSFPKDKTRILNIINPSPSYVPRKIDKTLEKIIVPSRFNREDIISNIKKYDADYLLIRLDGIRHQKIILDMLDTINNKYSNPIFDIDRKFRNEQNGDMIYGYWVIPIKENLPFNFLRIYNSPYDYVNSEHLVPRLKSNKLIMMDMNYPIKVESVLSQLIGTVLDAKFLYSPKNKIK